MKKYLLIVLLSLSSIGCRGVNRLLNGPESPANPSPDSISSDKFPTTAPNLGTTPTGYTRTVYFGRMPTNGTIQLATPAHDSIVVAYIYINSLNQWFSIASGASDIDWYYYMYNSSSLTVTYHNQPFSSGYLVYQYVKVS